MTVFRGYTTEFLRRRARMGAVVLMLVLPAWSSAQQAPPAAPAKPMAPLSTIQNLRIIPLAGAGEMNDLARRVMASLVVEVLDQNDRPIEGAEVVFRFPIKGPSATFANDRPARTVRSDAQGQAAALNWTANSETGTFQVHVTASYANQVGETDITMSNVATITDAMRKKKEQKPHFWSSKKFKIGVVVAAAAITVGVVLATRGSSSSTTSAPPTVTISVGPPVLGGSH
jgi:hypothetical protein